MIRMSKSRMGTLLTCEEKYRQRYVHGRKEPPAAVALFGTAVGDGVDAGYMARIAGREVPKGLVADTAVSALEVESEIAETEVSPEEIDEVARCSTAYWEDIGERDHPEAVQFEETLQIEAEGGDSVNVLSYIDLVEVGGRRTDLKVKSRTPNAGWELSQLDAPIYTMASPGETAFRYVIVVRNKVPKVLVRTRVVTPEEKAAVAREIIWASHRAQEIHDNPELARPTGYLTGHNLCSEKWCAFASGCRAKGIPVY